MHKQIKIIHKTKDYIVVNKPSGIASIGDWVDSINMLSILRKEFNEIHTCHRLDKETSGVMLFARSSTANTHLSLQFQRREIKKTYHTVVEGRCQFTEKTVDVPLLPKSKRVVIDFDKYSGAKKSKTVFRPIQYFGNFTLLECFPETGRLHQIRAHLSWIKHPIVGDQQYNGHPFYLSKIIKNYKNKDTEKPLIDSVVLHAQKISFNDLEGNPVSYEASYSKKIKALVNQLKKSTDQ